VLGFDTKQRYIEASRLLVGHLSLACDSEVDFSIRLSLVHLWRAAVAFSSPFVHVPRPVSVL
jgi:hypothetical protein